MSAGDTRFGGGDDLVAIQDLEPGTRIRLRGDIVAEVTENPRDGMWIVVRYLETPAGPVAGERSEMAAADDVLARVEK
jgi:hypothetical protein